MLKKKAVILNHRVLFCTKILNRMTGEINYGIIPENSVVVAGSLKDKNNENLSLHCAVIVKMIDGKTISKTSINEILRDYV